MKKDMIKHKRTEMSMRRLGFDIISGSDHPFRNEIEAFSFSRKMRRKGYHAVHGPGLHPGTWVCGIRKKVKLYTEVDEFTGQEFPAFRYGNYTGIFIEGVWQMDYLGVRIGAHRSIRGAVALANTHYDEKMNFDD